MCFCFEGGIGDWIVLIPNISTYLFTLNSVASVYGWPLAHYNFTLPEVNNFRIFFFHVFITHRLYT